METKDFIKELEGIFECDEQELEITAFNCVYGGELEELSCGLKGLSHIRGRAQE